MHNVPRPLSDDRALYPASPAGSYRQSSARRQRPRKVSALPQPGKVPVVQEFDFNTALQRASVDWGRYKKLIVCSNCGGQTVYDSEQVTGACPFCGSTSVAPAAENDQIMVPNAVIPFAIGKEQVQDLFTENPPDLFGQLPDGQKIPAFGSPKAGMNR